MFKKEKQDKVYSEIEMAEVKSNHRIEINELHNDYKLKLKEKEFELKHYKDDKVAILTEEKALYQKEIGEMKVKIEMLGEIVDLNADIVDVKNLVNTLIEKIPTIDLKSLTINQKE